MMPLAVLTCGPFCAIVLFSVLLKTYFFDVLSETETVKWSHWLFWSIVHFYSNTALHCMVRHHMKELTTYEQLINFPTLWQDITRKDRLHILYAHSLLMYSIQKVSSLPEAPVTLPNVICLYPNFISQNVCQKDLCIILENWQFCGLMEECLKASRSRWIFLNGKW